MPCKLVLTFKDEASSKAKSRLFQGKKKKCCMFEIGASVSSSVVIFEKQKNGIAILFHKDNIEKSLLY